MADDPTDVTPEGLAAETGAAAAAEPTPDALPENPDAWRRVSRKYITVEVISWGITALIFFAATIPMHIFVPWVAWVATAFIVLLVGGNLLVLPRRVRAIGFQLRDDDLLFRKGIMFHRQVAVPYGRMQLVDINRGPLLRAFGLSELKFVTAATSSDLTIPGLPFEEAEQLRDELVALAETRRAGL